MNRHFKRCKALPKTEKYPIGGKRIHDANIIATMLTNNVSCLLTHNTKDFAQFADLISVEGIVGRSRFAEKRPPHINL